MSTHLLEDKVGLGHDPELRDVMPADKQTMLNIFLYVTNILNITHLILPNVVKHGWLLIEVN